MNKEDMIKYALMAVGAYLVWQWLTQPGGFLDPNKSAAAQVPGEDGVTPAVAAIAAATPAAEPAKPRTQDETDVLEYNAGLQAVQDYTKPGTGYTTEQLGQIEQWFYAAAKTYKSQHGNMNGFNGWILTELPGYSKTVKGATPDNIKLASAALDASKASLTGSYKLSGHQWNWYRMQAAISAGIYDAAKHNPNIAGLDANYTASEYHALLSAAGLGGIGSGIGWGTPAGMSTAWRN